MPLGGVVVCRPIAVLHAGRHACSCRGELEHQASRERTRHPTLPAPCACPGLDQERGECVKSLLPSWARCWSCGMLLGVPNHPPPRGLARFLSSSQVKLPPACLPRRRSHHGTCPSIHPPTLSAIASRRSCMPVCELPAVARSNTHGCAEGRKLPPGWGGGAAPHAFTHPPTPPHPSTDASATMATSVTRRPRRHGRGNEEEGPAPPPRGKWRMMVQGVGEE